MADFAALMAPYIGKKAVVHESEFDGSEGYFMRKHYLGRLVAATWDEESEVPVFEFDREDRYRGKYFTPSSSDWENFRFKDANEDEDEAEEEDYYEMRTSGDGGEDHSYDIDISYKVEDYKRAKKQELTQTRIQQQRYIELLEKCLDKDGVIQMREGQIKVNKKFFSFVSPVFKKMFAKSDVIQIADHDPADVELFIQLLTGKLLPSGGIGELVNLVKLFDAFQAGSILQCVPGCREKISEECAKKILKIKPAVADDELLEMCRQISGAKRRRGL